MTYVPDTAAEQTIKQTVRANTRGGANSYANSADPAAVVNEAYIQNGLNDLSVPTKASAFVLTVDGNDTASLTGANTAQDVVDALAASPVNVTAYIDVPGSTIIGNSTLRLFTPGIGGDALTASGDATVTNISLSSGDIAQAYPQYAGPQHAQPTWIDDATVHAYQVVGQGAVIQDTSRVVQTQVRQVRTGNGPEGALETQQWDGYFAVYQSNLNQTQQKNTKQQQC